MTRITADGGHSIHAMRSILRIRCGTVQLTARYEKGKKELQVSLYQTVVLLLFNDADVLSYKEIKENTRMGLSLRNVPLLELMRVSS